jgi:hypothetical protein
LLHLFFEPEDEGDMSLRNNGIHGIISQKTEFFITTAVKILNPM